MCVTNIFITNNIMSITGKYNTHLF